MKTADHISGGRLILGMGAGWFERDYREYGYEFGTPRSRLDALEQAVPIIKHRWEVDVPKPVRNTIPILIGGGGVKRTLRIVAEHGDIWHSFGDPATIAEKNQILNNWCKEVGRDPQLIERAVGVTAKDGEDTFDAYVQAGSTHLIFGMGAPWNFDVVKRLVTWRDKRAS